MAQKVILNAAGQKIIQYEDGTWRYFEGRDSMLESNLWQDLNLNQSVTADTLPPAQTVKYDYRIFQKYIAAAVRYESLMMDRVDRSSTDAHTLEDQINSLEKNGHGAAAADLKVELDFLNEQRQDEQRLLSYARSLIKKILKVGKSERYAKLARIYVPGFNADLGFFSRDSSSVSTSVKSDEISPAIKETESSDLPLYREDDNARERQTADSVKLTELDLPFDTHDDDTFNNWSDSSVISQVIDDKQPPDSVETKIIKVDHSDPDRVALKGTESRLPRYTVQNQQRWFSQKKDTAPVYQCEFTFHGVDEFSKKLKKELKSELFFTYTDERLKPYLKENDYITCSGYLTSMSGGYRFLTLLLSIASKNASKDYGVIKSGSLLNLKLLDGQTVSLFSQVENQGTLDSKTGTTTYKVWYPIDFQKEKLLIKSGVDKVRVVWSSGFEDYEVYNVDFFLNQFTCLNRK